MHTGLACIEVIAQLYQLPIDMAKLVQDFGQREEEISAKTIIKILKSAHLKAKKRSFHISALNSKCLPALFIASDGTYGLVLKINPDEKKVLYFTPDNKQPQETDFDRFFQFCSGQYIVITPKLLGANTRFGIQWFLAEILRYKQAVLEILLGAFAVQFLALATPIFTQLILDKVVVHQNLSTLYVLAIAFILVALFEFLLNISRNYIFAHIANKIDARLGSKLFSHLLALPFPFFEARKVGNIVSRVRELDNIRDFITNKAVASLIDSLFVIIFLAMMLIYSLKLTAISLLFVGLLCVTYAFTAGKFKTCLHNKLEMNAQSNAYVIESMTGIQTVKALAIEGSMQRTWEGYLGDYIFASFKLNNISNLSKNLSGFIQRAMTFSILFFGVKEVIAHQMTLGQLIAFQMFSNQLITPILRLVNLLYESQQALLGIERLGDILNHPLEMQSLNVNPTSKLQGAIRFKDIHFSYGIHTPKILDNFTFDITPGSFIGIVGSSGSGKSTLTKLIQRLYIPQSGSILIDNYDITQLNPTALRKNIGIVLQESYLFSGTIRENINMSQPDAPIENIIRAAEIAGAHSFIKELPEGYDTLVGERGSTLSGGQKQRIAIARALLTNPHILIFDEATASLDYESESLIQEHILKMRQGRTIVLITHRLANVRACDNIIVMEKGHIVEKGTPEALIKAQGKYYSLMQEQEKNNASIVNPRNNDFR